ncbi:FAD/NAD(P)-binding domain-containing protein [Dendrothele bispora CBS 962.96]|uniref:FAD/NAD(P)-binding domain-containing protein n=1 Tax=Dendrothele bispora (strain CBS 962.96) TaxID=1314807 RepID=A0A4S8M2J8_DENBC|nr:FAD/NAD(P)-binding domain-containing protein [Dendrothele bispora CBS 962.96]
MKKLGIPCSVFEQDAAIDARERDWSFGVYWAQSRLGECLPEGVDETYLLENVQVDKYIADEDAFIPCLNGVTGELTSKIPTPFSIRLQRRKFIKLLSQGIDIHYGKQLTDIKTEGGFVTASFEDGTKEEGRLLVGCDGAKSKVRNFLLGPEKGALRQLPFMHNAAVTTLPAETALAIRKMHRRNMFATHPNGSFLWISVQDCSNADPSKWSFMFLQTWTNPISGGAKATEPLVDLATRPEIVQDMRNRAKVFAESFSSLWQTIPDDAPAWHGRVSDWPTEPWDNRGAVTLAGDAAHPMTYHRGQGLNNAISDAASLLHALLDHYPPSDTSSSLPFAEALKVYESEVWERGREAVLSSAQNTVMMHDWDRLLQCDTLRIGIKPRDD